MKHTRRPYRMRARAEAAAETGRRIVSAVHELLAEQPYDRITVAAVAERAHVTVQTVLRRHGSRERLLAAAIADGRARILAQRGEAPAGDRAAAVRNLFDHYERWGRVVLHLLEQEERVPAVRALVREGRVAHAAWVERVFAPDLAPLRGRARSRRRTQLVVATDVYVWKLLRTDLGIACAAAEELVRDMVDAICPGGR